MLGTVMSALDSSIVNVCLPNIMASFGASIDDIEWVVTGYMLGFSTFMPLTAWMRDRIGHRRLYLLSLAVFTCGSVLCGLAWSLPALVFARVIQAFGGGAITPTGMAMIAEVFPPAERGRALGIWGVGVILGPAIGPTIGGYLTETLGWRSIFNINLPIGLFGLWLANRVLRHDAPKGNAKTSFDRPGFVLLTLFLVSGLLGLSKGNQDGWTSPFIVGCGLVATASLIAFLVVESVVESRILDLSLFRHGQFAVAMTVTGVRSVALYGGTFLLPLFMQTQMGLSEVQTGVLLLPGALMIGAMMPFAGRLADRIGARTPTIVGLVLVAAFMFTYTSLDTSTSTWNLLWPTLVRGFGLALLVTPVMTAAINSVPTHRAGMASSMLNLIQQVAGSAGIAALAAVLGRRTHQHLAVVGQAMDSEAPVLLATTRDLTLRFMGLGFAPRDAQTVAGVLVGQHAGGAAAVFAFNDAFLVGGVVVLLGAIPALFLAARPRKVAVDPSAASHALAD